MRFDDLKTDEGTGMLTRCCFFIVFVSSSLSVYPGMGAVLPRNIIKTISNGVVRRAT